MAHQKTYRGTGRIAHGSGAAIAALQTRAAAWEVPLIQAHDRLSMHVWGSELRLIGDGSGTGLQIELVAPETRLIGTLRDSATELFGEIGLTVEWDHVDVGALAPGLSLMKVVSVSRPVPSFIRIRLQGPDSARFATGGLHFRLILPPAGRAPVWPRVAANGRTVWPDGADQLHRPVYTVLDQQQDWIDFDIFRHAASPTCDWADSDPLGQEIGIMGPGGNWPDEDRLRLFGDETALPVVLRILRLARGKVSAAIRCNPAELRALTTDRRVSACTDLLDALRDQRSRDPDSFIWFAAGADTAQRARQYLRETAACRRRYTVASYWT